MKALKIIVLIVAVAIVGALAFLAFSAMKAPGQFVEDFRRESSRLQGNLAVLSYPDELLERKTSLDARLAMSDDDSIGLRMNLNENALYLEIKGIVLHKTPIREQRTSGFFKHLSAAEKYVLFRKPMVIKDDESNIAKDTFQVVVAPKDTIEASARSEAPPDTVLHQPVLYRLYFTNGIRLQVIGKLNDTIPQFWPRFHFEFDDRVRFLKNLVRSILHKETLPYQPTISIVVDAREAESMYRAIPRKGNVIFEF